MKGLAIVCLCCMSINLRASEDLTAVLAEQYALYAMMSSNAYHDECDENIEPKNCRTRFPIEKLGWRRVLNEKLESSKNTYSPKFLGILFSNLQYDIWEHEFSDLTVFAFKGTGESIDWITSLLAFPVAVQYKSAKKHVKQYINSNQSRKIILTGHSLGGGIALSTSLWLGLDAIVFNSSPRVFDGMKDHNEPAKRIAIYQAGELLQKIRKIYFKFDYLVNLKDKTKNIDVIKTNFSYKKGESKHRADLLAEGLLRCSKNNPEYLELARRLVHKVNCNF